MSEYISPSAAQVTNISNIIYNLLVLIVLGGSGFSGFATSLTLSLVSLVLLSRSSPWYFSLGFWREDPVVRLLRVHVRVRARASRARLRACVCVPHCALRRARAHLMGRARGRQVFSIATERLQLTYVKAALEVSAVSARVWVASWKRGCIPCWNQ